MSDDLVKRLREKGSHYYDLRHEAADALEAQRQRIASLKKKKNRLRSRVIYAENALAGERERADANEKDAERYRWIVATATEHYDGWAIKVVVRGAPSIETIHAAIDAARKELKK